MMRRLLQLVLTLALLGVAAPAWAQTIKYVKQNQSGDGLGGDANNAMSMANFNSQAVAGWKAILVSGQTFTTMPRPSKNPAVAAPTGRHGGYVYYEGQDSTQVTFSGEMNFANVDWVDVSKFKLDGDLWFGDTDDGAGTGVQTQFTRVHQCSLLVGHNVNFGKRAKYNILSRVGLDATGTSHIFQMRGDSGITRVDGQYYADSSLANAVWHPRGNQIIGMRAKLYDIVGQSGFWCGVLGISKADSNTIRAVRCSITTATNIPNGDACRLARMFTHKYNHWADVSVGFRLRGNATSQMAGEVKFGRDGSYGSVFDSLRIGWYLDDGLTGRAEYCYWGLNDSYGPGGHNMTFNWCKFTSDENWNTNGNRFTFMYHSTSSGHVWNHCVWDTWGYMGGTTQQSFVEMGVDDCTFNNCTFISRATTDSYNTGYGPFILDMSYPTTGDGGVINMNRCIWYAPNLVGNGPLEDCVHMFKRSDRWQSFGSIDYGLYYYPAYAAAKSLGDAQLTVEGSTNDDCANYTPQAFYTAFGKEQHGRVGDPAFTDASWATGDFRPAVNGFADLGGGDYIGALPPFDEALPDIIGTATITTGGVGATGTGTVEAGESAPSRVTDLIISSAQGTAVKLQWAAPGPSADGYLLKYSTTPWNVTSGKPDFTHFFNNGQAVQAPVTPAAEGALDSCTVNNLQPGTKYYFAISSYSGSLYSDVSIPTVVITQSSQPRAPVARHPYPHIGYYHVALYNQGVPYFTGDCTDSTCTPVSAAIDSLARYQLISFMPDHSVGSKWGIYNQAGALYGALQAQIRNRNPTAKIITYDHGGAIYGPWQTGADSTSIYNYKFRAARNAAGVKTGGKSDATLYRTPTTEATARYYHTGVDSVPPSAGGPRLDDMVGLQWTNVNFAYRDPTTGDYVVADSLATALANYYNSLTKNADGSGGRLYDGVFHDIMAIYLEGEDGRNYQYRAEGTIDSVDIAYAGFSKRSYFWQDYKAGALYFLRRFAQLMPGFDVSINHAGGDWDAITGIVREGYFLGNNTFKRLMYGDGYASSQIGLPRAEYMASNGSTTPMNLFLGRASAITTSTTDTTAMQANRFGLGTACLFEGSYWNTCGSTVSQAADYRAWNWDESWVDRSGAFDGVSHGWLGMPRTAPYQKIWRHLSTNATDYVSDAGQCNADTSFESGSSGWSLVGINGTVARDVTTGAVGSASVKMTTTTQDWSGPWSVRLVTSTGFSATANATYQLSFYAKASVPRQVNVYLDNAGGSWGGHYPVWLTTSWKQYALTFTSGTSATIKPYFMSGDTLGSVWIDDVHVFETAANVWVREFDNGIVVVNPTAIPQKAVFDTTGFKWKRISGRTSQSQGENSNPNDGGNPGTTVWVAPEDARFLYWYRYRPLWAGKAMPATRFRNKDRR